MATTLAKRLTVLFLVFASAFGIIGSSVGLNSLIKSNRSKAKLRAAVPPGMTISIDTNDVLRTGIVTSAMCIMIGLIASVSLKMMVLSNWKALGAQTQRLRGWLLAFFAVWLGLNHSLYTYFFWTRQANVRLWQGDVELPQSAVQAAEKAQGSDPVYRDIYFLQLLALLPWVTFFVGSMASVILLVSPRDPSTDDSYNMSPTPSPASLERGTRNRVVPVSEKVRLQRSVASLDDSKVPM